MITNEPESIFSNSQERRPSKLVFSGDKYYTDFVETYGFYPNIYDYITFCYNRITNGQYKYKSMPNINLNNGIECYEVAINCAKSQDITFSPSNFTSLTKRSQDRSKRIEIENS